MFGYKFFIFIHLNFVLLVVIICCSCSLNLANGMLAYDTGDTRLGMARTSIVTGDGYKRTDVLVDRKGPVGARVPLAPDLRCSG